MRRWTEIAERVAATTKTSEKTAILAEYLAGLSPDELPIAAVFLTGRPFPEADQRSIGVGWAGLGGAVLRVAGADPEAHAPGLRPLVRRRHRRGRGAGGGGPRARPGDRADAARGRARRSRRSRPPRGRRPRPQLLDALLARSSPRTATGDRQGAQRRAADRAPRGPARGGHREGLRPPARRGQAGRDADRRRRADRDARPRGPPGRCRAGRCSTRSSSCSRRPAEDAAEIIGRLGPDGLGRGQVRRHPRPAPPGGRRGAPVLARPARHQRPVPRGGRRARGTCRGPGSSTASCSPGATASCCRSCSSRRGWAARTRPRRSSPTSR